MPQHCTQSNNTGVTAKANTMQYLRSTVEATQWLETADEHSIKKSKIVGYECVRKAKAAC